MSRPVHRAAALALALALAPVPGRADGHDDERIEDNSFLVEEAYNQEAGVVQHVFTFQQGLRRFEWVASFTEEWPAPDQRHQLSLTLTGLRQPDALGAAGLGDLLLNYRHEMVRTEGGEAVFTGRLSLVVPSGDARRGLGLDHLGLQVNLPLSLLLGQRFATHLNLGGTWVPGALAGGERGDLWTLSGGASLVWFRSEEHTSELHH